MKKRLLDILVCPRCKQKLALQATTEKDGEVLEGDLRCPASHVFPVIGGIPRFVDSGAYVRSFGFQWNKFSRVQLDICNGTHESEETYFEKTGFAREAIRGRLVLDAGTGAGRFADVVSRLEGEVVGVDLSTAVDAAYQNLGTRANVHFIQADIFHLPFEPQTFELIFSIGVLHHTPDTKKAFTSLVPLLKNGGEIAIWVYDGYTEFARITDRLRKVTTRIPGRFLYWCSTIAIPLYYLRPLRTVFEGVFRICMHRNWRWRWLDTFDYFSPKFQWKHTYPEVFSWFQEAGLTQIVPLPAPVSMKGRKTGDR